MKAEPEFKIRLPCWFPFSGHEWTDWEFPHCYRIRHCIKCNESERENDWHRFSNWSPPYNVDVFDSQGRTVEQERQKRTCSDCQMVNERVVAY